MPPTDGVFLPRHASVAAEDLTAHVAVEHRLADLAEVRTANPAVEDRTAALTQVEPQRRGTLNVVPSRGHQSG